MCGFHVCAVVETAEEIKEEYGLHSQQEGDELRVVTLSEEYLEVVNGNYTKLHLKWIQNIKLNKYYQFHIENSIFTICIAVRYFFHHKYF